VHIASDRVCLTLGGELVALRPTLRCGLRLAARPGSFAKLVEELQEVSLGAALFVLRDFDRSPLLSTYVMDAGLEAVCAALVPFVVDCAGIDPDAQAKPTVGLDAEVTSVSFGEHLANLYRIGTGWIGWTPQTTLDATPAEIAEAYKGRVDMLKAVFGGGDDATKPKATPDQIRETFRQLGAKRVH
jgi:hypothetical protein